MRFKIFALILFGIVLALAGAFGTFHYTRALEQELASARVSLRAFGETTTIPVPRRDLAAGERVGPADFLLVRIPLAYLPPNVLRALPAAPGTDMAQVPPAVSSAAGPEGGAAEGGAAEARAAEGGAAEGGAAGGGGAEGAAGGGGAAPPEPAPPGHLVVLSPLREGSFLFDTEIALGGLGDRGLLWPAANGRIFAISLRRDQELEGALAEGSLVDLLWSRAIGGGKTETRLLATGLRLRQRPGAEAGPEAGSGAGAVPGDDTRRFLLEGTIEQAAQAIVASQSGNFDLLLSDGTRSTRDELVLIGPNDLETLPLAYREGGGPALAVAAPAAEANPVSLIGQITGGSQARTTCPTAVIRGGSRSVSEVPC